MTLATIQDGMPRRIHTNRIPYDTGAMRTRRESVELAQQARSYTVQVVCAVRQDPES